MPNSPAQDTVRISFTLPRKLNQMVEDRANSEMTNVSDIIRRALRGYFDVDGRSPAAKQKIKQKGIVNVAAGGDIKN